MNLPWFRLYHRTIDDDKLRLLAFEDRWHFIALCCLKADGLLDEPDSDIRTRRIAVKMGVQVRELDEIGRRLREVDLVDETLSPKAWDELQFKSDNSSARVRRHREKQAKTTVKRDETLQKRSGNALDTDTDTDSDTSSSLRSELSAERAPPEDLKSRIFGKALDWLAYQSNKPPDRLRPIVGRWCRDHGDGAVLEVLTFAARDGPVDPVAWIEAKLTGKAGRNGRNREVRTEEQDCRAILTGLGFQNVR